MVMNGWKLQWVAALYWLYFKLKKLDPPDKIKVTSFPFCPSPKISSVEGNGKCNDKLSSHLKPHLKKEKINLFQKLIQGMNHKWITIRIDIVLRFTHTHTLLLKAKYTSYDKERIKKTLFAK